MMKKLGLALLVMGLAGSLPAQTEIDYQLHTLDNGLDVILHEDHSTPIVAVSVLYHVGSKNERPGRSGFAHFFEHLMFEGSKNIERGEFMKLVQSNGGNLNANTSFDRTFYYEVLPSNQLELGLWLESERMLHATVDSVGVETQREVVKEEKRLRIDNQPYMSFQEKIFEAAFGDSTYYSTPPIGTFKDLNAAKMEDFKDFYNTFYVPNNATLSIAGDINPEETLKLVKKYFASIPRGTREIPRPEEKPAPLKEAVVDTVYDNIQLPGVFIGYRTPAQGTKEAYAIDMLAKLLSDGQSSRLYKEVVDNKQLAVTVQAFPYTLEKAGLFITFGIVNQGVGLDSLVQAIEKEFTAVRKQKISEQEYTKILNQLESDFVRQNSRMVGIAENLANYHVYYGNASLINNVIEKYRAITPEYLQEVAQEYLVPENRVVLYYLPENQQ